MQQFAILPRVESVLFEDDDIRVRTYDGGPKRLYDTNGTLFFAVIAGRPVINGLTIGRGMYGCLPQQMTIEGDALCRVMIVYHKRYTGIFTLSGPLEQQGRLRYINGCTDTGLLAPLKQGDPCLNALFFPPGTLQTPHRHPSHRVGAIFDGEGVCLTESGETPMRRGDVFIIPAQSLHWFQTRDTAMRIMVFHPDSDVGPTDERHQMLEATLIA